MVLIFLFISFFFILLTENFYVKFWQICWTTWHRRLTMCHSSTCWNVWPINGNCWWDLHQFPGLWPNCANWHWDGQWQVRYAPWQSWMTKTRQMNKRRKFLTLNFQDWMTLLAHQVSLISLLLIYRIFLLVKLSVKSKCEHFSIFLSLWFYVKSSLGILEMKNLPVLAHLVVLNLDFYEFLHFLKAEI